MMNRIGTIGSLFAIVTLLITGCKSQHSASQSSETPSALVHSSSFSSTAAPAEGIVEPTTGLSSPVPAPEPSITPHADKTTQSLGNVKPAEKTASPALKGEVRAYSSETPLLIGVALGENRNKIEERLGKPAELYSMEGDGETLSIGDYGGFAIGYSPNGTVVFVDVSSSEIDPGLHGLRLGQKADEAERALGKPDSSSSYVLAYETKTTVLKLDLDPKTKAILSIKLFGRDN